jgi:hypothetical protein
MHITFSDVLDAGAACLFVFGVIAVWLVLP